MAANGLTLAAVVAVLLASLQADAVQPKELEEWFASSQGLAMTSTDAEQLASQQWQTLTQCGITVWYLQSLKDAMFNHAGMDLAMTQLRREILPMAEQHVNPDKVGRMYQALSSGYTISGGLALPKAEAQSQTLTMLKARAEPDELYALYKVMYGYSGLGFDQRKAQQTSIYLAVAGADGPQFKATYQYATDHGAKPVDAMDQAQSASVVEELSGFVRRYAKDAKPYSAHEFQQYYGHSSWLAEWMAAPMELRISSDRLAHTASQFAKYFGNKWQDTYKKSEVATQKRLAQDGKAYTMQDFQSYYGDSWQAQWATSPELPCSQCAPFVDTAAVTPVDLVV